MNFLRLVQREIRYRKLNFALAVLSASIAVGVVAAEVVLLRAHDLQTEAILENKRKAADAELAKLEDDYRKYMLELGFNLLILPKDQEIAEFWEKGHATKTMPEEFVKKLANSRTETVRHLLPIVQQKVYWPETKRNVILIGTRGEVPMMHRRPKEPMLLAVPKGEAVIGHEITSTLGLKAGDSMTLRGTEFKIQRCRPEAGSAEDVTIWVDLEAAQKLLQMEGRINGIEALKCHCPGMTLEELKNEITGILPETRVIVRENKVTVRAKARDRAQIHHENAIQEETAHRARLKENRESFAAILIPLVIFAAAIWIGVLALSNVRERSSEIGILRALGVRSSRIVSVFLAKAVLVGLVGALLGYGGGLAVGLGTTQSADLDVGSRVALLAPDLLALVILAAPLLSAASSWVPALLAGRQDPAEILSKE